MYIVCSDLLAVVPVVLLPIFIQYLTEIVPAIPVMYTWAGVEVIMHEEISSKNPMRDQT